MQYVLGIDSGGTKYLVYAMTTDGAVLGKHQGPTCAHYQLGEEGARLRIIKQLNACLQSFGGNPQDCRAIVCGTTGYDSDEDGEILARIYESLPGYTCPACCMNDVELAHYTVTGGRGILVLAGTGSIAFGRNQQGEERRAGGWPIGIMGEEGSGRYIDAKALRHYARVLDGCAPHTPIIDAIQKAIGSDTRKGLMDYAMAMAQPSGVSPNLGPAVCAAAQGGDVFAQELLRDAGRQVYGLAEEIIRVLHMEHDREIPVGIWGGLLTHSSIMQEELAYRLALHYPQARILRPSCDAAQGAAELAVRWHRQGGDCRALLCQASDDRSGGLPEEG